jgi:hypothetical protein
LALNYHRKGKIKEHSKRSIKARSLMEFFRIISNPLATIIDIGNKINSNSTPFFSGKRMIKIDAISKLKIIKSQLFLNVFFTDNAFGVFNNIAAIVKKPIKINGIKKIF